MESCCSAQKRWHMMAHANSMCSLRFWFEIFSIDSALQYWLFLWDTCPEDGRIFFLLISSFETFWFELRGEKWKHILCPQHVINMPSTCHQHVRYLWSLVGDLSSEQSSKTAYALGAVRKFINSRFFFACVFLLVLNVLMSRVFSEPLECLVISCDLNLHLIERKITNDLVMSSGCCCATPCEETAMLKSNKLLFSTSEAQGRGKSASATWILQERTRT